MPFHRFLTKKLRVLCDVNPYLERVFRFEIFEKTLVILLYWFAAQKQTSTCRRKTTHSWNELTPSL